MTNKSSGSEARAGSRSAGSLRWLMRRTCAAAESVRLQPEGMAPKRHRKAQKKQLSADRSLRMFVPLCGSLFLQPHMFVRVVIEQRRMPALDRRLDQEHVRIVIQGNDRRGREHQGFRV